MIGIHSQFISACITNIVKNFVCAKRMLIVFKRTNLNYCIVSVQTQYVKPKTVNLVFLYVTSVFLGFNFVV